MSLPPVNPLDNIFLLEQAGGISAPSPTGSSCPLIGWSESQLAEYFARLASPPILATVETSARCFRIRKELIWMASSSHMVNFGVIAFVALELESSGSLEPATYTQYSRIAKTILEDFLKKESRSDRVLVATAACSSSIIFIILHQRHGVCCIKFKYNGRCDSSIG